MKTAEEWVSENGWLPWRGGDYETIKRIQLDALREAAEIADNEQLADMAEGNIATQAVIVKAILTRIKEVEG